MDTSTQNRVNGSHTREDQAPDAVAPGLSFDEAALVERAKAGDVAAFSELVTHYDRRVFRMAKQITQNDDDAEDVLQETFLKAYSHLDDFQGNSKFYTWIVRISVNEALMKLRKRRSDRTGPDDFLDNNVLPVPKPAAVPPPKVQ